MKQCSNCRIPKDIIEFEDRTDAWGNFSWCYSCRIKEGRTRISKEMEAFMDKTRLFNVMGDCGSVKKIRKHSALSN